MVIQSYIYFEDPDSPPKPSVLFNLRTRKHPFSAFPFQVLESWGMMEKVITSSTNACHSVSLGPLMQFSHHFIYCCFALTFPTELAPNLRPSLSCHVASYPAMGNCAIHLENLHLYNCIPYPIKFKLPPKVLKSIHKLRPCPFHSLFSPPNSPLLTNKSDSSLSHA